MSPRDNPPRCPSCREEGWDIIEWIGQSDSVECYVCNWRGVEEELWPCPHPTYALIDDGHGIAGIACGECGANVTSTVMDRRNQKLLQRLDDLHDQRKGLQRILDELVFTQLQQKGR